LLLGSALLAGCAAPQVAALLERPDPLLPERTELAATPFFPQELYQVRICDMHYSLSRDLTPLETYLDMLRDAGYPRVTTLLERGDY